MNKITKWLVLAVILGQSLVAGRLHEVAGDGILDEVKRLLNSGANVDEKNEYGWTPLMSAAQAGETETVIELLNRGANVQEKATWGVGSTALMMAAASGHIKTVKELLNSRANIDARDKEGGTAIGRADNNNHKEIIKFIQEWSIKNQVIISDSKDKKILDGKIPGSYNRDFFAYGRMLERKREAIRKKIEEATKIPAEGPARVIQEYLGDE